MIVSPELNMNINFHLLGMCVCSTSYRKFSVTVSLKTTFTPSSWSPVTWIWYLPFSAALSFLGGSFFHAHSFLPFLSFHDTVSSSLPLTLLILSSMLMFILSGIFCQSWNLYFSAQLFQLYFFNLFYFIILFWERISSCNTDWIWTYYVAQDDKKLKILMI